MADNDPLRADSPGNDRLYDQYIQAYRPIVYSVCRRYLRNPEDVEDAVQETFIKLARYLHRVHGSVVAWLTSTAYSSSVDLIRRAASERRRRQQLAWGNPAEAQNALVAESVRHNVRQALLLLDEADRRLLIQRFFRRMPLRIIAREQKLAVPTISRKLVQAVEALGQIFRDLGFENIDDLTLAEQLGGSADLAQHSESADDGLRFAPDWRTPALDAQALRQAHIQIPCLPGWRRPIRLGVLVSLKSLKLPPEAIANREQQQPDAQVWTTQAILHPGIQMVGIVEPDTAGHGVIERTVRDYELTAGLIDGSDVEALRTLDVILLGVNYAMEDKVASAFNAAVHEGVGLLNDYWTDVNSSDNPNIMDLLLASSPIYAYHVQPCCGIPLSATVMEEHPLLPGLRRGNTYSVRGCGPLYRVQKNAKVLISKDRVIQPDEHRIPGSGPAQMPVYIVGHLGRGRVVVTNVDNHPNFAKVLALPGDYFFNLLSWLAEPRRREHNRLDIIPAARDGTSQLEF